MKIPPITGIVSSAARYCIQSSWQGRSVQVVCAVSFLALIYYVAFRSRKNPPPSETLTTSPKEDAQKANDKFGEWLSKKMTVCESWITKAAGDDFNTIATSSAIEHFIPKLKKKIEKSGTLLKPMVETEAWDAFMKDYDSIIENCKAEPLTSCKKLKEILEKLQSWNARLQEHVINSTAQHPHVQAAAKNITPPAVVTLPAGSTDAAPGATEPKKSGVSESNTPAASNKSRDNSSADAEPDFLKDYPNEFGDWLVDKIENCNEWINMGKGDGAKQASCLRLLRQFIPELKEKVEKMIPVFQSHPEVKIYWTTFFLQCDAIADPKGDPAENSLELKTCLTNLQDWNDGLRSRMISKLIQQISDLNICPHYEFTDFQKHYFPYLGLVNGGFSRFLQAERGYLAEVGLSEMEDIDILQLRTMQPSIKRLRQLVCFFNITKNEEFVRPLIEEEMKKCTAVLKDSNSLIGVLKNGEDLEKNLQDFKVLFGKLQRNLANGLPILKEIEKNDIARQLIQLKGYIHQQDRLPKWKEINQTTTMTRLAPYAKLEEMMTLTAIYQMWDLENKE